MQIAQGFKRAARATSIKKARPRSVPPPASQDRSLAREVSAVGGLGLPGGSTSDSGGLGRLLRSWGKGKEKDKDKGSKEVGSLFIRGMLMLTRGQTLSRPATPRTLSARSSIEFVPAQQASASPSRPASRPTSPRPPSPLPPTTPRPPPDAETPRPGRTQFDPRTKDGDDAYLRRILADTAPPSSSERETLLDALRAFTAVERLEGENAIGCRRCWKMKHGRLDPFAPPEDSSSSDGDDEESSDDDEGVGEFGAGGSGTGTGTGTVRPRMPVRGSSIHHKASASVTSLPSLRVPAEETSESEFEREPSESGGGLGASVASLPVRASFIRSASAVDIPSLPLGVPGNPYTGPVPTVTVEDGDAQEGSRHRRERAQGGREPSSSNVSVREPDAIDGLPTPDQSSSSLTTATPDQSSSSLAATTPSAPSSPASSTASIRPKPAKSGTITLSDGTRVPRAKQVLPRPTLKRYLVARPPRVLVLHLKRFQQVQAQPFFSSPFKRGGSRGSGGFTGQFNTGAKLWGGQGLRGGSDIWGAAGGTSFGLGASTRRSVVVC